MAKSSVKKKQNATATKTARTAKTAKSGKTNAKAARTPAKPTKAATGKPPAKATAKASPAAGGAGELFPDFALIDHTGATVTRASLRGVPAVIYFYPEADTPVCTKQACGFNDGLAQFKGVGARVLGVSPDEPAKLNAFVKKFKLGFTLLSDAPGRPGGDPPFMTSLGVWGEKSLYGNTVIGVRRTTFLLDGEGRIVKRWDNVRTNGHAERVIEALKGVS